MCEHRQSRNGKGYIVRKKMYARALAIVLAISMVGCGSNNTNIPSFTTSESLQAETGSVEIETSSTSEVTIIDEVTENEADVISTENPEDEEESIKAEEEAQRKAEEERKQAESDEREPVVFEYFTPHCMRHTFATRCYERGVREKVVQKILGHSKLDMTLNVYTHTTDEMVGEDIKKLEGGEA